MIKIGRKKLKILLFLLFKVGLFFIYCCVFGCTKTIKIKTNNLSIIEYVEPKKCKIRKINVKRYKTKIVDNRLTFNRRNLGIFIQNINDYKLSVKEFEMCCNANEKYYKSIISEILK